MWPDALNVEFDKRIAPQVRFLQDSQARLLLSVQCGVSLLGAQSSCARSVPVVSHSDPGIFVKVTCPVEVARVFPHVTRRCYFS